MQGLPLTPMWASAASAAAIAALLARLVSPAAALGVAAGGAWNLASLFCLSRLFSAWLLQQPSTWRVVGWLLVKFPLLYGLAFAILRTPGMSLGGFGVGFSIVLAVVAGWMAVQVGRTPVLVPRRSSGLVSHGR